MLVSTEALKLYMNVGEKDRSSKEGSEAPKGEKINGAKEAANVLAEKDKLVKKSIEEKEKKEKQKSTPSAPPLAPESETTSSSKRPATETSGGPRKKAKIPTGLAKPETEYEGDRVAKYFDKDLYFGTVGEHWYDSDDEENLWRINYDDGDQEDLAKVDFIKALKLYEREMRNDPQRN